MSTWDNREGLDRDHLLALLRDLGNRLAQAGESAEMYVAGGAAMLLAYGRDKLTLDVDTRRVSRAVAGHATAMAAELHLAPDWLNASMGPYAPPPSEEDEVLTLGGLTVRIAGPRAMLAMKLAAGRGRDYEDIRRLLAHLNITTPDEAVKIVRDVYGEDSIEVGPDGLEGIRQLVEALLQNLE